jgi:tetratricopeptide (TPR) repeat protein
MAKATPAFDADELVALALHDLEKERLDSALEKLKTAAGFQDCPPQVYAELGRLYAKLKLFERAQPMFERYLKLRPRAIIELFQLGMAYFDSGKSAEAFEKWTEVLQLAPMHPPAMFFTSFYHAQQGDLIRAYEGCRAVLANVASDNLYFGRAKDLMQRIDADPAYLSARSAENVSHKAH